MPFLFLDLIDNILNKEYWNRGGPEGVKFDQEAFVLNRPQGNLKLPLTFKSSPLSLADHPYHSAETKI